MRQGKQGSGRQLLTCAVPAGVPVGRGSSVETHLLPLRQRANRIQDKGVMSIMKKNHNQKLPLFGKKVALTDRLMDDIYCDATPRTDDYRYVR